jgi:hypothetical protein
VRRGVTEGIAIGSLEPRTSGWLDCPFSDWPLFVIRTQRSPCNSSTSDSGGFGTEADGAACTVIWGGGASMIPGSESSPQ